jgi:hypothetical protein
MLRSRQDVRLLVLRHEQILRDPEATTLAIDRSRVAGFVQRGWRRWTARSTATALPLRHDIYQTSRELHRFFLNSSNKVEVFGSEH